MNILIVGVGGQGTLLTSRVLGKYADIMGYDCKLSEVHGMAQRGGSVVTHVRFADKLHSPIIWEGGADIVLAFEKLEALRSAHYCKKDGILLVNDMEIYPMPVITGATKYPEDINETLKSKVEKTHFIDALKISEEVGNIKALNIVMVGALAKLMGFDFEKMQEAVVACVPEKFKELNLNALKAGYDCQ